MPSIPLPNQPYPDPLSGSGCWTDGVRAHRPGNGIVLDTASAVSPPLRAGGKAYNGHFPIHVPAGAVLQRRVAHLLKHRVGRSRPEVCRFYASLCYQAQTRSQSCRVATKVEWPPQMECFVPWFQSRAGQHPRSGGSGEVGLSPASLASGGTRLALPNVWNIEPSPTAIEAIAIFEFQDDAYGPILTAVEETYDGAGRAAAHLPSANGHRLEGGSSSPPETGCYSTDENSP